MLYIFIVMKILCIHKKYIKQYWTILKIVTCKPKRMFTHIYKSKNNYYTHIYYTHIHNTYL